MSRLIDADALMADCQLAQKQASRHDREFANAFYSCGGEISTEWWCVEDMIENAPTIEERKTGEWITHDYKINGLQHAYCECTVCGGERPITLFPLNYCPHCGADMRGTEE